MIITHPAVKSFIYDILTFEDAVDANSKPVKRTHFQKSLLRGVSEVKKLIADAMEVGLIPEGSPAQGFLIDQIKWISVDVMKEPFPGLKAIAERHTDRSIEISEKGIEAIRHYYNEREEVSEIPVDAWDELENILK